MKQQAKKFQWYDWCVVLTGLISSAIPLLVFGLFYVFNTFQAWNHLTVTTFEPMIAVIQEFLLILEGFSLDVVSVRALFDLLPEAIEAFSNAGNIVILWTQTTDFFQQIRSVNLVFEGSKVLVLIAIISSDVTLVIQLLKKPTALVEEIVVVEVPSPTTANHSEG